MGLDAILDSVRRCWASLYTERAVTYRLRKGYDERRVLMAVIVQRMVPAQASGVAFTAEPLTANRRVVSIEAVPGLGEALVSGRANADVYKVRDGAIRSRTLVAAEPTLTDERILELAGLARRIEAHLDQPQDIEWCLDVDGFQIVQSRPITTLFPIPESPDEGNRVYVSVGHQQMMTEPMKPLGISVWKLTSRAPMRDAGGRLFIDVTAGLASPTNRAGLLDTLGKSDPLIRDALEAVLERDDFPLRAPEASAGGPGGAPPPSGLAPATSEPEPALVAELISNHEASVEVLRREMATKRGPEVFDAILADLDEMRRVLFDPRSYQILMTALQSTWWLNDNLGEWLGEINPADTLTQSAPGNVTSEMGLALLDVADAIRPHPEVVAYLETVEDDDFLDELPRLPGGEQARAAILSYLERYGMRCVGEIDITRLRWSERPSELLPLILSNVRNSAPGEAARRFERGRREASRKEEEIVERLLALPDGAAKAAETRRRIERLRAFIGYREYPKYGMVSRYFVYKQALMREAERLAEAGVIADPEDVFFLTFAELHEVGRTNRADPDLIRSRRAEFDSFAALTPPRVLTSDGEALSGAYRRADLPDGALPGLAVSAGVVEGRARVIHDIAEADLAPGDILVTPHTDPSWSPLFVAAAGLVTEVGGLMTHGAVVAREYGLPAVVGVERATQLIRDGQQVRLNGTAGYVEPLP